MGPPASRTAPDATIGTSYLISPTRAVTTSRHGLPGFPAASIDSWEPSTLRSARSNPAAVNASTAVSKFWRPANKPTTSRLVSGMVMARLSDFGFVDLTS